MTHRFDTANHWTHSHRTGKVGLRRTWLGVWILGAIGLLMLINLGCNGCGNAAKDAADEVQEAAAEAAAATGEAIEEGADAVGEAVEEGAEAVGDAIEEGAEAVGETVKEAQVAVEEAGDAVKDQ